MESLLSPSVSLLLCVSPSSVIADNLVMAFQMAGHNSEVHFPESSYCSWRMRFIVQALGDVCEFVEAVQWTK